MSTITVPRPDVTTEEVAQALRARLPERYAVLAGERVNLNPVGRPEPDHPDTVVAGIGEARIFHAQVTVSHAHGQTLLHVGPGGLIGMLRLINRLWIAPKLARVLRATPGLS
jgi:hypothetical protein